MYHLDLRDYQLRPASSSVTCRHDCGLLFRQAIFRGGDRAGSWLAIFGMSVIAYLPTAPARRPRGGRREEEAQPAEPEWLAAWRELSQSAWAEPGSSAGSRELSQRLPGACPAMPARLSDALPRASPCAAAAECSRAQPCRPPARAAVAPYRQAPHTWPGQARSPATRRHRSRSGQYQHATNQRNTRSTQQASIRCSAGLTCYQTATRKRYPALRIVRGYEGWP